MLLRRKVQKNMVVFLLRQKDFEGLILSVGGVLGLNSERQLTKRVTFDDFKFKIAHYILKELKGSEESISAVKAVKYGAQNKTVQDIVDKFKADKNPLIQKILKEKLKNILKVVKRQ